MQHHQTTAALVNPGVPAPGEDRCENPSDKEQEIQNIMTQRSDRSHGHRQKKSGRPTTNKDIRDVMTALHAALCAAPIATWDAGETELVLDAVSTIIAARKTNVVAFSSSQEQR